MKSNRSGNYLSRSAYLLPFLFFSFGLIYANSCGLYQTHDSEFYLRAAGLMQDQGRISLFYSPLFSHWPPLYPFVLSFFTDIPLAYSVVHLGCMMISFWLWLSIGTMVLQKRLINHLYGLLLAFSTPWLLVGHFIWSEAIFILLFSAYLYFLLRFMVTEESTFLIAATVFAFLLPWQRIAGVFIFMGVAAGVLIFYFPLFKKHWRKWLLHGLISSSSFLSWFFYTTFVLDGRGLREKLSAETISASIWQSILEYLQILSRWLVPELIPDLLSFSLVLIFLIGPAFFISRYTQSGRITGFLWTLMLVYLLLYISAPAISAEVGGIDETERFLSVIYPIFFLSVVFCAEQFPKPKKLKFRAILTIFTVLWLLYPALRFVKNAHFFHVRKCQLEQLSLATMSFLYPVG